MGAHGSASPTFTLQWPATSALPQGLAGAGPWVRNEPLDVPGSGPGPSKAEKVKLKQLKQPSVVQGPGTLLHTPTGPSGPGRRPGGAGWGGSSHHRVWLKVPRPTRQGSVHNPWPTSAPLSGKAWAGTTGSSRVLLRRQPPNMDRLLGLRAQPAHRAHSLCFSACSSAPTRPSPRP